MSCQLSLRASPRWGLLAASLLHLPFLLWFAREAPGGSGGWSELRSWAALACCALLLWTLRPLGLGARAHGWVWLLSATAGTIALLGVHHPRWWLLSWTLLGLAAIAGAPSPRRFWIVGALWVCVYPFERNLAPALDPHLQSLTAWLALPLVNGTGLPVALDLLHPAGPTLVGENLYVTVTSLCAGTQTLLTLLTLGLVVAQVFVSKLEHRLVFVALTPLFGFAGNVLRVAVSTHAATRWGQDPWAWAMAHDGAGYFTFTLTYAALFWVTRRLRRSNHRPRTALSSDTVVATATTQAPHLTNGVSPP